MFLTDFKKYKKMTNQKGKTIFMLMFKSHLFNADTNTFFKSAPNLNINHCFIPIYFLKTALL